MIEGQLRDEGEDCASRLQQVGVPVPQVRYDDMHHGSPFWLGLIDVPAQAMDAACAWLKENL